MTPSRNRTPLLVSLIAAAAVGGIAAVYFAAPDQIAEAEPGSCVLRYLNSRYMDSRYLLVDSCDSPYATHAVVAADPVSDDMREGDDWERDYCIAHVDGEVTGITVVEIDGRDHIVCLSSEGHD